MNKWIPDFCTWFDWTCGKVLFERISPFSFYYVLINTNFLVNIVSMLEFFLLFVLSAKWKFCHTCQNWFVVKTFCNTETANTQSQENNDQNLAFCEKPWNKGHQQMLSSHLYLCHRAMFFFVSGQHTYMYLFVPIKHPRDLQEILD